MKNFAIAFDRLFIRTGFSSAVHVPFGCVGVYEETRVPTQKIIGEWVQCPVCEKIHVYSCDIVLRASNCDCDTPGVNIVRQAIRDDGFVSVINEQALP